MKTIIKMFVLALILSSCIHKESEEYLYAPWYHYSLLAKDTSGHLDTVYMCYSTASRLTTLSFTSGDTICVQKTSIGYVYSPYEVLSKEVVERYFGIWEANRYFVSLPISEMYFQKMLCEAEPMDPLLKMQMEDIRKLCPR